MIFYSLQRLLVTLIVGAVIVGVPFMLSTDGVSFSTIHAQETSTAATPDAPAQQVSSCSFWDGTATFDCWFWIPFMSSIGALLLTLAGGILLFAGTIFDFFVQYLVVNLNDTISTKLPLLGWIEIGWELFRNVANIVIIGVFVFVAIMTILGSLEYGAKRLISRVLVIAILINFSLLFTRIIVESTNFVSGQFWRAMPASVQSTGTAQSFLKAFGMDGTWTQTNLLVKRAGTSANSGWAALLYGIFSSIALLAIAAVLFYGTFVISARFLLLIFAMLTSSMAFASFLLPNTARQPYIGWTAWWSNLIKAAMFGPLLMIFLWLTVQLIEKAGPSNAGAAIGSVAYDPSKATATEWQSLILLMTGTGMLFIAIRAAGSFSSSIGGFNWAGLVAGSPLSLTAALAGAVGRNAIGGRALFLQKKAEAELPESRKYAARLNSALQLDKDFKRISGKELQRRELQAAQADKKVENLLKNSSLYGARSKMTFDGASKGANALLKSAGAKTLGGEGKSESFGTRAEKAAKESATQAEGRMLTSSEKSELKAEQREVLGQQKEAAQKQLAVAEKSLESIRASQAHQEKTASKNDATKEIEKIAKAAGEQIATQSRSGGSQTDIQRLIAERDSALKEQEHKITTAHAAITTMERDALKRVTVDDYDKLREVAGHTTQSIAKAADAVVKKMDEHSVEQARRVAGENVEGNFGAYHSTVSEMARNRVRESKENKENGGSILKALKDQLDTDKGSSSAAGTP